MYGIGMIKFDAKKNKETYQEQEDERQKIEKGGEERKDAAGPRVPAEVEFVPIAWRLAEDGVVLGSSGRALDMAPSKALEPVWQTHGAGGKTGQDEDYNQYWTGRLTFTQSVSRKKKTKRSAIDYRTARYVRYNTL